VPLTDIQMTEEDVDAVLECLRSGWLTMGPRVQAFEQRFADYIGVEHAAAVSSGPAALHLAARLSPRRRPHATAELRRFCATVSDRTTPTWIPTT
jgi:dTDP-4-amino-4,6-dideoxygalactose transaminase